MTNVHAKPSIEKIDIHAGQNVAFALDAWQWNEINLTIQPSHYLNGQLNLRCIAQIPGIYKVITDVQLNAWEPVPERGNSAKSTLIFNLYDR